MIFLSNFSGDIQFPFPPLPTDMEAILNQIISATVAKFASALSEKTNLPTEEIIKMWKAAVGGISVQVDGEKATKRPAKKTTKLEEAKPSSDDEDKPSHTCSFKPKKGNNVCGKAVGDEGSMCAAHKRYEGVVVDEKTCGSIISKGDRKGETCGAKVKDGSECCSKHTKKVVEKPDEDVEKKPEEDSPEDVAPEDAETELEEDADEVVSDLDA